MSDNINSIIRRTSAMVDTSGRYPAPAIQTQTIMAMGGGIYPQTTSGGGDDAESNVLTGRISLGIVAAMVIGALLFYVWTNEIQGGG